MDEAWARNPHLRSLAFARVHIDLSLFLRPAYVRSAFIEGVNNVVVGLVELCLREIRKQRFVPPVAVDDEDLAAAVAGYLVRGLLKQRQLQAAAVGHGAGFVARFGDLSEIVFGKDHCVLLLGRVKSGITHIEEVGAERKMRAVLFQDSEWKQAGSLRPLDASRKSEAVSSSQCTESLAGDDAACARRK